MTRRVRRSRAALAPAPVIALALVMGLGLAGCGDDPEPGERANAPSEATRTAGPDDDVDAGDPAALESRTVTTGLTSPWGLSATSQEAVLLSERDTGRILRVDPGSGEREELRTLPDVVPGGEAGLLGLALTPDESALLAYYTVEESSRIVSMPWDGQSLGEPEVLLEGIPGGAGYHQGGALLVGPDDLLYVGTGDNGVPESAQDRASLSGKVLRLTLDGQPAPGNPFDDEVYSYGHRNVQGLAFDDEGRLWASEFGANAWDELNLVEAGADYGWPQVEGSGGGDDAAGAVEELVHRHVDEDRAAVRGAGQREGLVHPAHHLAGGGQGACELRDRRQDRGLVELLEAAGAPAVLRGAAADDDHGGAVELGLGDGADAVGDARSRGQHREARHPGELAGGLRGEGRGLLVAHVEQPHRRVGGDGGVVHREDVGAGEGEHRLDAVGARGGRGQHAGVAGELLARARGGGGGGPVGTLVGGLLTHVTQVTEECSPRGAQPRNAWLVRRSASTTTSTRSARTAGGRLVSASCT